MKKQFLNLLVGLAVTAMSLSSCSKKSEDPNPLPTDEVVTIDQKNKAIVIDITGTWCPPCGAYGIPGFNKAISLAKDRMVPFAIHSGDPLSLAAMDAVAALPRFKSGSVPRIAAGNGLVFPAGVYSDINATGNQIVASVDTFIANNQVIAGVTLKNLKIEGGKVSVDVHSKFFSQATGEYQIAVFFYENGVVSSQKKSGQPDDPNQKHDHVVRAVATTTAWGESLPVSLTATKKNYSATFATTWNSANMGAMVLIWKKNGADYAYVNGNIIEAK